MPQKYWKILNIAITAGAIYAAARPYERIAPFVWYALIPLGLSAAANFIFLKRTGASFWHLVPPLFFLVGFFAASAAVSWPAAKIFLSAVAGLLFFAYENHFPQKHSIFLEELFVLATGFLILLGITGINFYFNLDWWISSALVFVLFFFIFSQQFYKMKRGDRREPLYAAAGSLIVFEFFWIALFWPVHFLTLAVTVFAVFYMIYMISNLTFAGHLTRRKVYFHAFFMLALVLSGLLSSAWQP